MIPTSMVPTRLRYPLISLVLAILLAVPFAVLAIRNARAPSAAPFRGSEPPPGITAPDFALRDHAGRSVRTRDLRGKAVAVTFLDSQCTEACPVIATHVRNALALLAPRERRHVAAVAISTDPRGDTRRSVGAFLRRQRVERNLRYLVGSEAELRPVWRAFQVASSFDTGDSDMHSAPVRVFDRGGEWVSTLHAGADLTAASLAHDLSAALRADT